MLFTDRINKNERPRYGWLPLLCLLISFTGHAEISDEKKTLIDELIELNGDIFVGEEMAFGFTDQIKSVFENAGVELDAQIFDIILNVTSEVVYEEFIASGELNRLSYQIWGKNFDTQELRELVAFYQSSLGQKLLKLTPELAQTSVAGSVKLQNTIAPKLQQRLLKRLRQAGFDQDYLHKLLSKQGKDSGYPSDEELEQMSAEKCAQSKSSTKRIPIHRGMPEYPIIARSYSVEGWVDLSFSVDNQGNTENVQVIKTSTGTLFNAEAIRSVNNYKYCPGEHTDNHTIRVRFEMAK